MKNLIKAFAVLSLLLVSSPANAQVSFGFSFGTPPPPPRVYRVPPQPGPDYIWVNGYWYPNGRKYAWHDGYWTRPPYDGAYWNEPYWDGRAYVDGYWSTPRGNFKHDRFWKTPPRRKDERRDPRHDDRK
jgi:hypothetical protein